MSVLGLEDDEVRPLCTCVRARVCDDDTNSSEVVWCVGGLGWVSAPTTISRSLMFSPRHT